MVPGSLAAISLLQLLLIFALERTTVLRRLTKRVFLEVKDSFGDIGGLFGDEAGSVEATRTEDVLRITDLISALFGSALNLVVGAAAAIAVAVIGTQTRQRPTWMVTGAYIAGGVCVAALIVLLVMILLKQVQDHANWRRVPRNVLLRGARNAVSPRTPDFYKLIVLVTSGYLLVVAGQYAGSGPGLH